MKKDILLKELIFSFARSSGSGGQHVNKVSTKVELYFDVHASKGIDLEQKNKIWDALNNRINADGYLRLQVSSTRSQLKNRQLAIKKFFELIEQALTVKKKRKIRRPSSMDNEKRLKTKKHHADKKNFRKKIILE
jgi:ribosome-associated protein